MTFFLNNSTSLGGGCRCPFDDMPEHLCPGPGLLIQPCDLIGRQPDPLPLDPIYLKWVAVPQGENTGDMLYWDGTKWVTLAAPSGGDFVLMSNGGAPYWQQVQEFECPGSST